MNKSLTTAELPIKKDKPLLTTSNTGRKNRADAVAKAASNAAVSAASAAASDALAAAAIAAAAAEAAAIAAAAAADAAATNVASAAAETAADAVAAADAAAKAASETADKAALDAANAAANAKAATLAAAAAADEATATAARVVAKATAGAALAVADAAIAADTAAVAAAKAAAKAAGDAAAAAGVAATAAARAAEAATIATATAVTKTSALNERYNRDLFEAAPDPLIAVDRKGIIEIANNATETMTGYQRRKLIGTDFSNYFTDPEKARNGFDETFAKGSILNEPLTVKHHSGHLTEVLCSANVYKNETGVIQGVFVAMRDITLRKKAQADLEKYHAQLEEMVSRRTAELEAVNKELETFSYTVSHDLRAPLRAIDGFSRTVIKKYSDNLPNEGLEYLERVRAASQRMAMMIDDILALSRVSRAEMSHTDVDLTAQANVVFNELTGADPDRKATVIIAPGLVANGDPGMINQILENLLTNAWKFTSHKAETKIQFGEKIVDAKKTYFIKDNGAGFDTAYEDMLFKPFQRLHSVEEFAGSGIGLATVQRLIHKHGGKIWAEGEVGIGATFYFTLT